MSKKIKEKASSLIKRFGAYLKRLLFPLYLFPIKLITYTASFTDATNVILFEKKKIAALFTFDSDFRKLKRSGFTVIP